MLAALALALLLASCGPVDHPLGADLDGRQYYVSCSTNIPSDRLGDVLDGVVRWVPEWAETKERVINGLALEDGFAIYLPENICGPRAKWVLLFNNDLSGERTNELVAGFSGAP